MLDEQRTRAFPLAAAAAALMAPPLHGFAAPRVGILCTYLPKAQNLVCSIRFATYVTSMNEDCVVRTGYEWQGWQLYYRHRTVPICAPNTLWRGEPSYVPLTVGETWRRGIFTCVRTNRAAVTCRTSTGHGLYAAYGAWRAWLARQAGRAPSFRPPSRSPPQEAGARPRTGGCCTSRSAA
jgi:hypothetical protein